MRVTFLLPHAGMHPIGGFKVAYEYANYLAGQGHIVSIVHPSVFRKDRPLRSLPLRARFRTLKEYWSLKWSGGFTPASWFRLLPAVKTLWVPSLSERFIPAGDIMVATSWETAEWAAEYGSDKGSRFYLIQHLETWSGPEDRVLSTWKMPLRKIVIARWLQKIAQDFGQEAHLCHNGLDFASFDRDVPFDGRDPNSLLMLFHEKDWKGSVDGLQAYDLARKQIPTLRLTLFGLAPRPEGLDEAISYHCNPPQKLLRKLYNEASIFLSPSWAEGFPLPPAEALQCGAALVSTDIDGTAMYAFHEQTALLSPIKNPDAMAANIVRAFDDPTLRLRLAQAGHDLIRQFTWEAAGSRFEQMLLDHRS